MDFVYLLCARFNRDEFGYRVIQAFMSLEAAQDARDFAASKDDKAEFWIDAPEITK